MPPLLGIRNLRIAVSKKEKGEQCLLALGHREGGGCRRSRACATAIAIVARGGITKPKGTGLGLAIVKKLIEEHGGNIWIESTPADGACVRFQLPVTETDATSSLSSVSVDREHG